MRRLDIWKYPGIGYCISTPLTMRQRAALWLRGWRHTHWTFWTKPRAAALRPYQGGDHEN